VVDHKTKIGKIKKVEKEGQVLETRGNADSERHNSLYQWRENEAELKTRVRRYSTRKHHIENVEIDFLETGYSDGSSESDDAKP